MYIVCRLLQYLAELKVRRDGRLECLNVLKDQREGYEAAGD